MPRGSIQELKRMPEVRDRLNTNATRAPGGAKVGDATSHYLYVDQNEIRLKSDGVGILMTREITGVQPGRFLSFQVPYQNVDFNKMYFHPAADIPSSAVFPHATFTQCWNDPAIKLVNGVFSALKAQT